MDFPVYGITCVIIIVAVPALIAAGANFVDHPYSIRAAVLVSSFSLIIILTLLFWLLWGPSR